MNDGVAMTSSGPSGIDVSFWRATNSRARSISRA